MKAHSFSRTGFALAAAFLTMPLIAAEKAVEGTIDPFLGKAKLEMQQLFTGARLPNVVVAKDGTVLATQGATGGGGDWWKKGVQVRRSEDGGKTWGEPITIANPGWQGGGLTVDETSGDILAFVEQWEWPKPPLSMTVYRSTDRGKTWKAQKTVIHPDSNGNVPGMHMAEHGITLRHGKHKGRLLRTAREWAGGDRRPNYPKMHNTAIYSDGGGKTWRTSDPFPAMGTGEGAVAELSDGRIYYSSRRHWDPKGLKLMRHEAWSDDGGATWKDLAISKVLPDGPRGAGIGCHGGLVRLPVRGRDILLFSNCDNPGGDRCNGTVWASFDGAKTWPIKRLLGEGRFAYSSLAAGRPKTPSEGWIYLQYEGIPNGDRKWRSRQEHENGIARFNLSWLLGGEKTGDGAPPDCIDVSAKTPAGPSNGDGLVSIFDGETLDGWHAVPKESASDWSVQGGVIVGRGSADRLAYLVWKDADLTDFELQLRYRLPGKGNTGVEIRSQPDLSGKRPFEGYHADLGHVGIGPHILGAWDFHFARRKEYPCNRGTRLIIDEDGKPHSSTIRGALTLAQVRPHQWNDVRIIARGNHFQFFINGTLSSEFTDNATQGRLDQGAIGLQIHDKGMHVEFKDVRLKRLIPTTQPEEQVTADETDERLRPPAGETLYNGIELPDQWPPQRDELKREPTSPPYLKNPPKVIPINVGRQLLVDDFLIEKSDLQRTFHHATYHEVNPVIKADQPWETGGKSCFVAPYQGAALYDPKDQLFKIWYKMGRTGDYYCTSVG